MKNITGKKNKTAVLTAEQINRKTRKQILTVILAGIILIAADTVLCTLNRPDIVQSYGQLYIIRPEAGAKSSSLALQAQIEGKQNIHQEKLNIMLKPYEKYSSKKEKTQDTDGMTMTEQERISYEVRTLMDTLSSDTSKKRLQLPEKLESGEKITWEIHHTSESNAFLIIVIMILLSLAIYKNRMAPIEKVNKDNLNSILRQLPEFVNRLVLLLNAGLVLSTAFEKAVEENKLTVPNEDDYFSRKLNEIYISVTTANGSMHKEFRNFARESGSKELMRIANIISENVSKGVELTSKLQNESELLWLIRKKSCEERGRLAETKLTLPLVIFLMALIVITIAPAMLEL